MSTAHLVANAATPHLATALQQLASLGVASSVAHAALASVVVPPSRAEARSLPGRQWRRGGARPTLGGGPRPSATPSFDWLLASTGLLGANASESAGSSSDAAAAQERQPIWILKPTDSSQGRKIFLIRDLSEISYGHFSESMAAAIANEGNPRELDPDRDPKLDDKGRAIATELDMSTTLRMLKSRLHKTVTPVRARVRPEPLRAPRCLHALWPPRTPPCPPRGR